MAKLPPLVAESPLSRELAAAGLKRIHQGKVRDTWEIDNDLMLQVASDRVSIFDFVLPGEVKFKGEILTAMTIFWPAQLDLEDNEHHLLAWGGEIDRYLPSSLRRNQQLWQRGVVVLRLKMLPVEWIERGYLTGSGFKSYRQDGTVCGEKLPDGLRDGDRLPDYFFPLFSPTNKAEEGHDLPLSAQDIAKLYGPAPIELARRLYSRAHKYALMRGIVVADTKFEIGYEPDGGGEAIPILGDEWLTPDSSRFWDEEEWRRTRETGKAPKGFDKQYVRNWGMGVETPFGVKGINNLDPAQDEHVAFVHSLEVPEEILTGTTKLYLEIFQRLGRESLTDFQRRNKMFVV